jgi:hypothetical protein
LPSPSLFSEPAFYTTNLANSVISKILCVV